MNSYFDEQKRDTRCLTLKQEERKKMLKQSVQKFGRTLSGMVMPNIGAFIAWGLITALFIPTGWPPFFTAFPAIYFLKIGTAPGRQSAGCFYCVPESGVI
jgi:hypothetical protein